MKCAIRGYGGLGGLHSGHFTVSGSSLVDSVQYDYPPRELLKHTGAFVEQIQIESRNQRQECSPDQLP